MRGMEIRPLASAPTPVSVASARIAELRDTVESCREASPTEARLKGFMPALRKVAVPMLGLGLASYLGGTLLGVSALTTMGAVVALAPVVGMVVGFGCIIGADLLTVGREARGKAAAHELEALTVGTAFAPGARGGVAQSEDAIVVGGVSLKRKKLGAA